MFMTSAESQKYRAINGSYNPTIPALYKDKDVLAAKGESLSVDQPIIAFA